MRTNSLLVGGHHRLNALVSGHRERRDRRIVNTRIGIMNTTVGPGEQGLEPRSGRSGILRAWIKPIAMAQQSGFRRPWSTWER